MGWMLILPFPSANEIEDSKFSSCLKLDYYHPNYL